MSLSPTADAAAIATAGNEISYFFSCVSTLLYADVPPRVIEAAKELAKMPNVASLATPSAPPKSPMMTSGTPFTTFNADDYYIHGHDSATLDPVSKNYNERMDRDVIYSLEKIVSTGSCYIRLDHTPFPSRR